MKRLVALLLLATPVWALSIPQIAGITTIAVNSGTILRWARHPKRESKKAAHTLAAAVKGKN